MCVCGNHNYKSRDVCGKCSGDKAQSEVLAGAASMAGMAGLPANFRAGDWMCTCGNHNYSSRESCGRCSGPKPADGGLSHIQQNAQAGLPANFRPGDWMCGSCGNHNYSSKTACYKCAVPREQAGGAGAAAASAASYGETAYPDAEDLSAANPAPEGAQAPVEYNDTANGADPLPERRDRSPAPAVASEGEARRRSRSRSPVRAAQ